MPTMFGQRPLIHSRLTDRMYDRTNDHITLPALLAVQYQFNYDRDTQFILHFCWQKMSMSLWVCSKEIQKHIKH